MKIIIPYRMVLQQMKQELVGDPKADGDFSRISFGKKKAPCYQ